MTKIIIALIILFMPFYGCQESTNEKASTENEIAVDDSEIAATEVIKIAEVDSNGDLVLKDANGDPAKIFKVKPGKKIKWQIHTVDVRSIENIYKKTTVPSDDIFSSGPEPINNSKDWKATVDTAARYPQFIEYNIKWKDNADSIHIYHPRIQVKS